MKPVFANARSSSALAALLLAALAALLCSAGPASAANQQQINADVSGDNDAKLSIVVEKSKKGKLQRVKSLKAADYDLSCQQIGSEEKETIEVDFSFPAIKIESKRKGKYGFTFSGGADEDDPFTKGFSRHGGTAEGFFSTTKKGKPTKLVGALTMGAYSTSLPDLPGNVVCSDPARKNPFWTARPC